MANISERVIKATQAAEAGWDQASVASIGEKPDYVIAVYEAGGKVVPELYIVIEDDESANFVGGGTILYLAGPSTQLYAVSKNKTTVTSFGAVDAYVINASSQDLKSGFSPIKPISCKGERQGLTPRQLFCRDVLFPLVFLTV
jgi:hypothetical protein